MSSSRSDSTSVPQTDQVFGPFVNAIAQMTKALQAEMTKSNDELDRRLWQRYETRFSVMARELELIDKRAKLEESAKETMRARLESTYETVKSVEQRMRLLEAAHVQLQDAYEALKEDMEQVKKVQSREECNVGVKEESDDDVEAHLREKSGDATVQREKSDIVARHVNGIFAEFRKHKQSAKPVTATSQPIKQETGLSPSSRPTSSSASSTSFPQTMSTSSASKSKNKKAVGKIPSSLDKENGTILKRLLQYTQELEKEPDSVRFQPLLSEPVFGGSSSRQRRVSKAVDQSSRAKDTLRDIKTRMAALLETLDESQFETLNLDDTMRMLHSFDEIRKTEIRLEKMKATQRQRSRYSSESNESTSSESLEESDMDYKSSDSMTSSTDASLDDAYSGEEDFADEERHETSVNVKKVKKESPCSAPDADSKETLPEVSKESKEKGESKSPATAPAMMGLDKDGDESMLTPKTAEKQEAKPTSASETTPDVDARVRTKLSMKKHFEVMTKIIRDVKRPRSPTSSATVAEDVIAGENEVARDSSIVQTAPALSGAAVAEDVKAGEKEVAREKSIVPTAPALPEKEKAETEQVPVTVASKAKEAVDGSKKDKVTPHSNAVKTHATQEVPSKRSAIDHLIDPDLYHKSSPWYNLCLLAVRHQYDQPLLAYLDLTNSPLVVCINLTSMTSRISRSLAASLREHARPRFGVNERPAFDDDNAVVSLNLQFPAQDEKTGKLDLVNRLLHFRIVDDRRIRGMLTIGREQLADVSRAECEQNCAKIEKLGDQARIFNLDFLTSLLMPNKASMENPRSTAEHSWSQSNARPRNVLPPPRWPAQPPMQHYRQRDLLSPERLSHDMAPRKHSRTEDDHGMGRHSPFRPPPSLRHGRDHTEASSYSRSPEAMSRTVSVDDGKVPLRDRLTPAPGPSLSERMA